MKRTWPGFGTIFSRLHMKTAIGKKAGYHKEALLLAMIGGGKAGNIISPNPNTIAVSEAFKVDLTSLMMKNFIPAICAVVVTILLSLIHI